MADLPFPASHACNVVIPTQFAKKSTEHEYCVLYARVLLGDVYATTKDRQGEALPPQKHVGFLESLNTSKDASAGHSGAW